LSTPGAIGNVTKRTGDNGQGLEPDEGQLSRPVLRGLVSGNTHRLPGGSGPALGCWKARGKEAMPMGTESETYGTLQIPVDTFSATPGGARVAIES